MATLSFVAGGALFLVLRHTLLDEFDRSLLLRAHALASLVTQTSAGQLDIDLRLSALPEFTRPKALEFFSLQDDQGKVLIASTKFHLNSSDDIERWNTTLPSGAQARALRLRFRPVTDDEEVDGESSRAKQSVRKSEPLTLELARNSEGLHATLWKVGGSIIVASVAFSACAVLASSWIVQRGLQTVVDVASNAAALNVRTNSVCFEVAALPAELKPILSKFNELLAVLGGELNRERQFTAAVSHELRTPIAELRAAADIAVRDPKNLDLAIRSARHAQASAEQLQTIVETLLSIVSLERAAEGARLNPLEVRPLIQKVLQARSGELQAAGIKVDEQVDQRTLVVGNTALLSAVFDNLVSNAAQYAAEDSTLIIRNRANETIASITFTNYQTHLQPDEVSRLFDPFWRKESVPNSNKHIGLGLALARTYCEAMQGTISATLTPDRQLCITVEMKNAAVPLEVKQTAKAAVTGNA